MKQGRGKVFPRTLIYFSESDPDSQKGKVGLGEGIFFPPQPSLTRPSVD
jgi:hypothetical protein